MPDFTQAKIYRIWSPETDECYIGSTCADLSFRFYQHRSNAKQNYTTNCRSKYLINNFKDVRIELLEEYPCENMQELVKREGEFIAQFPSALNKCRNAKQSSYYQKIRSDPDLYEQHKIAALARYYKRLARNHPEHFQISVKKLKDKNRTDILGILSKTI